MENSEVSQGLNQCWPLNEMILHSMSVSLLSKYLNLALNGFTSFSLESDLEVQIFSKGYWKLYRSPKVKIYQCKLDQNRIQSIAILEKID